MSDETKSPTGTGDGSIILTSLLRRLPSLSRREFVGYHRGHHAPLFASTPAAKRHVRRYTIDHPRPNRTPGLPDADFDAVVRMWFAGYADLVAMFASPSYWRVIRPDEKRFFDHAASEFYLAKELVVIGEPEEASGFPIDWDVGLPEGRDQIA